MSAPVDFVTIFAAQLRSEGISFAITSGMACVHYGLQQTTKDSDWIVPAEDLTRLRAMFTRLEGALPPWRVSYRQICGAPLHADYMAHGWTSHFLLWDGAGSVEHRVDLFSKPPRVGSELEIDAEGFASAHVVARMKKTNRERDWPMVNGLGRQLWEQRQPEGLLHIMDPHLLRDALRATPQDTRERLSQRRPLLRILASGMETDLIVLERWLLIERLIWQRVNEARYALYSRAWRRFYRSWRQEPHWEWPTSERFAQQHERLLAAARAHDLPENPFGHTQKEDLVTAAVNDVCRLTAATAVEIAHVLPPVYELLP